MDCIFCNIVKGEIPSTKIYEDDDFLVILDAFPPAKGQTLIIPKKHIAPYFFDVGDDVYTRALLLAKKIAKAIDKSLKPVKTGLLIEGLEVDHVHIKLQPLTKEGFKLNPLDPKPSDGELEEIADKIKKALD
ncbi:MAG TPA: HIT domain-containing protein [Candidatus Pacearchaeota archaeon]|nr:HIT domain-containing protein [Candidatus Pacearchaeota archaeon]